MSPIDLPEKRQPDAVPERFPASSPSLWLYCALLFIALVLIIVAFKDKADWSGLFTNLATELLGAVIILILVERRLRESEIHAVRSLPRRAQILVALLVSPSRLQLYKYTQAFLSRLESLTAGKLHRPELDQLQSKLTKGFVLLAEGGYGKTTWLQLAAVRVGQVYLNDPRCNNAPILFPLARWLSGRSLEEAILEHINSFARISRRSLRSFLKRGQLTVMLDGANDLWDSNLPFDSQLAGLRAAYPKVSWTVSSRPSYPTSAAVSDFEIVNMTPPTEDELREIRRQLGIRSL